MQHIPSSATTNDSDRGGTRSSIDLLELFWRRRNYLFSCAMIGIALGMVYCSLAKPIYESTADVLVVQKRPQGVTGDNHFESGFEDYLATHLAVIASPLIVARAIDDFELGSLDSFADLEDPEEELIDAIIEALNVEGGSRELGENADSIMTLAYRSSVAEDCPIVVQALLDSYEAFHHEVWMSDNSVGLISQARDLLKNDLAEQEESYSEFRQNSPLIARGTDEVNPLQDRLTSIEEQRSEILLRGVKIERQLLALEQARQDGTDNQQLLALVSEMRQLASTENALPTVSTALESQLIQLVDDEQKMLEHYGPNHPHVMMIRERISATRRFFALPSTAHMLEVNPGDAETSWANDPVSVYTQYLEQELKRLQISEKLLTDLYDREHDTAKELSIFQLKDESFRRSTERSEALYDVVISRLQEASLIKDFGGFETRVIAPPTLGMKVGPSRRIIVPAATFVGILLGCMLGLVVELRDGNFQSCEHVQQQLDVPVLGLIPRFAAESIRSSAATDVALDPMLCSYYQPRSLLAESFRTLRTSLFFNGQQETSRVIQVTGPAAGEGASTVAANLAISLAQTGKRVLLIDADLRRQRQHQLFGMVSPEFGLAAIVASGVEPEDVILPTPVDNLWLLPAGPLPVGPCELFTSARFGELIDLVRDTWDYVLIDTEPLLVSSDACVIASQSDGVVLALRLSKNSRQRALRAKAMLDRLDARSLGVVVNQVNRAILKRDHLERDYAGRRHVDVLSQSSGPSAVTVGQ